MTENETILELNFHSIEFKGKPKDINKFLTALNCGISALEEIQQYREIGTVEECREAVEKQKAKKILPLRNGLLYEDGWRYKCPNCGCAVGRNVYHPDVTKDFEYCSMCGQRIEG